MYNVLVFFIITKIPWWGWNFPFSDLPPVFLFIGIQTHFWQHDWHLFGCAKCLCATGQICYSMPQRGNYQHWNPQWCSPKVHLDFFRTVNILFSSWIILGFLCAKKFLCAQKKLMTRLWLFQTTTFSKGRSKGSSSTSSSTVYNGVHCFYCAVYFCCKDNCLLSSLIYTCRLL